MPKPAKPQPVHAPSTPTAPTRTAAWECRLPVSGSSSSHKDGRTILCRHHFFSATTFVFRSRDRTPAPDCLRFRTNLTFLAQKKCRQTATLEISPHSITILRLSVNILRSVFLIKVGNFLIRPPLKFLIEFLMPDRWRPGKGT